MGINAWLTASNGRILELIEGNTRATNIAIGGSTVTGQGGLGVRDTLFEISHRLEFVQPSLDSIVQSNLDLLAESRAGTMMRILEAIQRLGSTPIVLEVDGQTLARTTLSNINGLTATA